MAGVVSWLHISDWHQGHRGTLDRNVVRDALMSDISRRNTECDPRLGELEFIIFSGDLAFRGTTDEYDRAKLDFLEPLLQAAGLTKDRLFVIPGNHDLDRSRLTSLPDLLKRFTSREQVSEAFGQEAVRKHFLFPMQAYADFVRSYLGNDPPREPEYGLSTVLESKSGKRIGILGLNSAWMCGQFTDPYSNDINDYGRLILGEHQLLEHLNVVDGADIKIGMMHHPFHWLGEIEQRSRVENELIEYCHFLLRGHEHKSSVSVPSGTAGHCAIISAGAAYDRREYPNGYNFVLLDLERGQGTVYLRRYSDEGRRFQRDWETTGDQSPGLVTFTLPKDLGRKTGERVHLDLTPSEGRIIGNPWAVESPSTMQAMNEIYARQHENAPFVYKLAKLIVKANSLANNPTPDEITTIVEFRAHVKPVYCHRISLFGSEGNEYLGHASWSVRSSTGDPVRAIEIPAMEAQQAAAKQEFKGLLLFFDPILEPESDVTYTVEVKEELADSMKPLRTTGRDELYLGLTRAADKIERVDLILLVPDEFGKVEMKKSSRRNTMAVGTRLDLAEMDAKDLPQAVGFSTLAWTGRDLPSREGGLFAVDLLRRPKPVGSVI